MTPSRDLIAHLARFAAALRDAGTPIALGDEIDAAKGLAQIDLADREEARLALRTCLKIERRAWSTFNRLFDLHWTAAPAPRPRRAPGPPPPPQPPARWPARRDNPLADLLRAAERRRAARDAPDAAARADIDEGRPGYSPRALLRRKSFDECTDEELAEVERLLARAARRLAARPSRRLVPAPKGPAIDLRRSFRRSLARGGELVDLARRRRAVELPRLVALCDTSGSMDPHSRLLLAFVLALGRAARGTEVFAFNTSLTRLTPWVRAGSAASALQRFASGVADWSGGTRIGSCLAAFAADHLRSAVSRDTSVLIFSDGLDRGEAETLDAALLAIRRRARRVIWLNPLMGDPRYRPEARGMRTALPHLDRLAPAHNLESLEALTTML